jgi:hypothetical protein
MGRALALLADGDVLASLQRHPFALPFVACAALWVLLPTSPLARGRMVRLAVGQALPGIAAAALLTWWAITKLA